MVYNKTFLLIIVTITISKMKKKLFIFTTNGNFGKGEH